MLFIDVHVLVVCGVEGICLKKFNLMNLNSTTFDMHFSSYGMHTAFKICGWKKLTVHILLSFWCSIINFKGLQLGEVMKSNCHDTDE